jgi:hypothetical protein
MQRPLAYKGYGGPGGKITAPVATSALSPFGGVRRVCHVFELSAVSTGCADACSASLL